MRKIQVLIVDDSVSVRHTLSEIINQTDDIEVIAAAKDPYDAVEHIAKRVPDVIILDIEMPRMDGLSFLQQIMSQHPIPVVMCSSLASEGSDAIHQAFEYGAVDVITKPQLATKSFLEDSATLICDTLRAAAEVKVRKKVFVADHEAVKKLSADVLLPPPTKRVLKETTEKVIVVGASTGGTEALRVLLEAMPEDSPGIVVVQHMPENFTRSFAQRLHKLCRMSVKEAENGESVLRGQVLIAPGNKHTLLTRSGAAYRVEIRDGPLVTRHRPSVDVLFRSSAQYAGKNAIGLIMTGMGDDGARGLLEMRQAGAYTIAQDEQSCVVFGMPKEAIRMQAACAVLPLDKIATHIYARVSNRSV